MAYKITGTVLTIGPAISFSSRTGNTYIKRDLVIIVRLFDPYTGQPEEQANNTPKFTFFGDRCRDLDNFKVGDVVTINFELSGRSYIKDGKTEYMTDVRPLGVKLSKQSANIENGQPMSYAQSGEMNNASLSQYLSPEGYMDSVKPKQEEPEELPF